MAAWFKIIELSIRKGRIYLKGHWMTGEDDKSAVPRNIHTQPIALEPMMPQEQVQGEVGQALTELEASKKGQPFEDGEKDEIITGIEKSNPLYLAMTGLLKAVADSLGKEMGMEVRVDT